MQDFDYVIRLAFVISTYNVYPLQQNLLNYNVN
jgi:hypothetical protein